ncbi:response regulator [Leptolyngbya sp. 7M]|nr:response regulator [Leptolyngbya sp. 7M]
MVSQDKRLRGVAPGAMLYSSAIGNDPNGGQPQECVATQTVANQNGGDVRAINFSFGESLRRDPRPKPVLDGNALLTQCVDWSSRVHNALYVISGNQGRGGFPIPTDTFNGMTIANSMTLIPNTGVFDKVDFFSLGSEPTFVIGRDPATERNVGPRRSVTLVAPGRAIATFKPDGSVAPPDTGGTSFASPHVTATVALLQEYGDRMIRQGMASNRSTPQWTLMARQQEVMKAVLMNSADKLQDTGDGLLLGMSRTLRNIANRTWLESDAYRDPKLPLDAEMGTGHLNAYRAFEQFKSGQWSPTALVPPIGWDYQTVDVSEGNDGISMLQTHPDIDIVLMDVMMPEMDGYQTMQAIRQMEQFASLPMIALTAKAMKGDREKCIEAGASDYITKPVDTEQLLSLLRVWLYR